MERLIRVLAALTRWGLGACALIAVLVALYVSLGRELIPLVAEYRTDVEDKARGQPWPAGAYWCAGRPLERSGADSHGA